MKKEYRKPYLLMESFQLNAAVASSCSSQGMTAINYYMNNCTAQEEAPDLNYFGPACAADGIDVNLIGADSNDGICYHGPVVDLATLFMYS